MKGDQKCFPVYGNSYFFNFIFFIAAIESKGLCALSEVNERIVHPRLADAEFFFALNSRLASADRPSARLDQAIFRSNLVLSRTKQTASQNAQLTNDQIDADVEKSKRAGPAWLSVTLMTSMVFNLRMLHKV
ncbi:glycine--tRNA ligase subunit beta [Vibrio chagasii]|nr:glycine--tRNA ligase subunit beta [Vibrio chagasii]